MKRKTPVRHRVRAHRRQGTLVKSFERGKGTHQSQRRLVKVKTTGLSSHMSVNYYTTKDVKVKEAIWDNFFGRGVEYKRDISKEDIEDSLKYELKNYEELKARKPRPFIRGVKKICRKKIKQLKYLLKMLDKEAK